MHNYKITVQYDGTDYHGWQSQPSGNTLQDEICKTIEQITGEKINLIGSGRTDSGVHALGQVANFKILQPLDISRFFRSVNSLLPNAISINKIEEVDNEFNARFDAKSRSYIYLINNKKSPFYWRYSYSLSTIKNSDLNRLNSLSSSFSGEHDFTSLCKVQTETLNKVCNVYEIHWRSSNDLILFYISANRFLHGMVRAMVGTILKANKLNDDNYLKEVLLSKNRNNAADSVPAKGLFLFKVKY